MAPLMGRRRRHDLDLPPLVYRKVRGGVPRYYYGREGIALGSDLRKALAKYAELRAPASIAGSFSDAIRAYRADRAHGLDAHAPATRREYARQLVRLERVFGRQPLGDITPGDVADFLDARPPHAGTREKALLSAVFNHARTRSKLTQAPNPCAGVRGAKSRRGRYVTDDELAAVIDHADPTLAAYLELLWRTGADASVALAWTRADVQDGALLVRRTKTGAKVRIAVEGPLEALMARLLAGTVGNVRLIRDAGSTRLSAIRARFWKARKAAGQDWQLRDLRAKAASDSDDARAANALLGHAAQTTTDGYLRRAAGAKAKPISRAISDAPPNISDKAGGGK